MGKVLQLPKGKKAAQQAARNRDFFEAIPDPSLRAAFITLSENDRRLARTAKLNLMEIGKRLENLEAIVFAQSVLIAELRGKPLTPQQRTQIAQFLKRPGNRSSE